MSLAFSFLFLGNITETLPLWENIAVSGNSLRFKGAAILELNPGEDLLPGFTKLLSKNLPNRSARQVICSAKKILTPATMDGFLEATKGGPNRSKVLKFEVDPHYCL